MQSGLIEHAGCESLGDPDGRVNEALKSDDSIIDHYLLADVGIETLTVGCDFVPPADSNQSTKLECIVGYGSPLT